MGYPLSLAVRYLRSKKRASLSVGTAFATLGVALGVASLVTVLSVTEGFKVQFRDKVLGVNAHVLVMKLSTEFVNYREVLEQMKGVPGVVNAAPFSINPMMLRNGDRTVTGVLVKGVDPEKSLGVGLDPSIQPVLDLPKNITKGENGETCPVPGTMECGIRLLQGLRRDGAHPGSRPGSSGSTPGATTAFPDDPSKSQPPPDKPDSGAPAWLHDAKADWEAHPKPSADPKAPSDPVDPAKPATKVAKDPDAPAKDGATDTAAADPPKADGPEGDITPDGGYKSKLPDEDELPPELTREVCDDPEAIKHLPGIIVGGALADSLDLKLGGCVVVTSPMIGFQFSDGEIRPPVAKSFRVVAFFDAGFDQYDSKLVYTDLYEAQTFYSAGDVVTGIEMRVQDIEKSDKVVRAIRTELKPDGAYRVMDWAELNRGLFTALTIQKLVMSGVLSLIIVVAGFTVIATIVMVVLDKKKEISVMKAMGATKWAIVRVFLYQGGMIGTVGTALGLGIGYGVCRLLIAWAFPLDPKVYFVSSLPVLMHWQEFAFTGVVAVVICTVATLIPSLYAGNLSPAEGFRDQ